ncbi:MAG: PEGA domain-containing protein [Candidatus Buchananbacteria bacterium]
MKLIYRRITYSIFILIFLIATPLILLYTSGYRYNFEKGRVQKTGILILSTVPRKAEISLNGKVVENKTTPAEIKNVLPGDYEITINKEGYHPWNKKLPVYENSTTFAEKIILWRDDEPKIIKENSSKLWSYAPDKQQIALVDEKNGLYIFSLNDSSLKYLGTADKNTNQIIWSQNNKKIALANGEGKDKFFDVYELSAADHKWQTISGYETISWPLNGNEDFIYGLNSEGIWSVNLKNNSKQLLADREDIDDFLIDSASLYLISKKQIIRQDLNNPAKKQAIAQTERTGYKFLREENNKLILSDNLGNIAVIDKNNAFKPIEINAKNIEWRNSNIFLYYNDFEIAIVNLEKDKKTIITRVSRQISMAIWHDQGRDIIYSSGNNINIIEIDDRELRNIVSLTDNTRADFLATSANGKTLYFSGATDNKNGIFKLELQ